MRPPQTGGALDRLRWVGAACALRHRCKSGVQIGQPALWGVNMGRHFWVALFLRIHSFFLAQGVFMKIDSHVFRLAVELMVAAGLPVPAFAQVIVYGPAATSVPTLSQWGMLILAVLLAMAAVYTTRKSGNRLLSGLLAIMALGVGVQGTPVGSVQAVSVPTMVVNTGGTIDLSEFGPSIIDVPINGHPSIPMRIISVTPASAPTTLSPTCAAGLVVNVGQTCYYTDPAGSGGG